MKFELTPVLNTSKGNYELSNFNELVNGVKNYIEKAKTNKNIEATRTDIRKHKKEITDARLKINDYYLGTFNSQLKELENLLKECDDELKAKLPVDNKPKMKYIKIGHYDATKLEQIKKLATELGCYVKEII